MALRPESMTFEMPQRPKPIEFAIQEPLDPMDLMVARENPAAFVSRMKNVMAAKLARMIVEKCQLFEVPDFARLSRDPCLRLQFTINDRGMYTTGSLKSAKKARKRDSRSDTNGPSTLCLMALNLGSTTNDPTISPEQDIGDERAPLLPPLALHLLACRKRRRSPPRIGSSCRRLHAKQVVAKTRFCTGKHAL